MKLQKLIIHNIASIEDATIDFDAKPLSESEVFLITGKTGSGKSTILDAICLALYATTPRMKNTNMQGDTSDEETQMKVDDPRQLLRRNTGEGYVRLTFAGSNAINYQAEWAVMKARKKATGNLQRKSWSLTNLQSNKTYTKDADIKAEIQQAIGLDFSQFCRTTILAQGEFTRFLNSDDDSKASILEKITGVDAYSKIGAKIYEVTSKHKSEYETSKRELDGVKIFSDEEVDTLKAEVETLREGVKKTTQFKSVADSKLKWINDLAKLTGNIDKTRSAYEKASEQLSSGEYRDQLSLIADWQATIDARKLQADIREARQQQDELHRKMDSLYGKLEVLRGGILWEEDELDKLNNELGALTQAVAEQSECEQVYNNAQTIVSQVRIISDAKLKVDELTKKIDSDNAQLTGPLKTDCDTSTAAEAKLKADLDDVTAKVQAKESELQALNVNDTRARRDSCSATKNDIEFARVKINALEIEEGRNAATRKTLGELFASIEKRKAEQKTLRDQLHETEIRRDTCQRLYEAQLQSVNDWAKEARRKLKIGDHCPVCGQAIEAELPHEDELASLYQTAEAAYIKERDDADRLRNTVETLETQIQLTYNQYDTQLKELTDNNIMPQLQADADSACAKLGVKYAKQTTLAVLDEKQKILDEQLAALDAELKKSTDIEGQLAELRKLVEQTRKAYEQAKDVRLKAEKKLEECSNNIRHNKALQTEKLKESEAASLAIADYIADTRWLAVWQEHQSEFAKELTDATKAYNDRITAMQAKQQALTDCKTALEQQNATLNSILAIMNDRIALTLVVPAKVENLTTELTNLFAEIKSTQDRIEQAKAHEIEAGTGLAKFFDEHNDISAERLNRLTSFNIEAIEKLRGRLEQIRTESIEKKSLLDDLQKQLEEHNSNKPGLTEDDTTETIKTRIDEYDKLVAEAREKIGALNRDLAQDKENKKSRGELIAKIERLKQEYERWLRLNSLIGSSDGKEFRKVAQSYVLGSLIHCANGYMRTLTDRYTLTVAPGTFVISLQDAYQDYVTRAATTISGGESFLVSLSLALALADIGQQLSVDTMFIDEGFGTLSGEPLRCAVDTLRSLHSKAGRHVGIISHVEELQERIPVQIQVNQQGNSAGSTIEVTTI